MFCGFQGLSPTYEQAHVSSDLLTLISFYELYRIFTGCYVFCCLHYYAIQSGFWQGGGIFIPKRVYNIDLTE